MTNTIRLKKRAAGGAAGAPSSLASSEPAYNEQDNTLYYGFGDNGSGVATSIISIAGKGAFADLTTAQTIAGVKTFSSTPVFSATHSVITDFDTQVRTSRLDQMAAPTASVAFNSQKITGLLDPAGAQDAATKNYVDNTAAGLSAKNAVLVATTASITLSGEQTIDGTTTSASRVLVKNQATASQNGIYVSGAGAWTRATDADAWSELTSAYVFVEQGTTNADTGWTCTADPGGTLGTTAVNWVQFSSSASISSGNAGIGVSGGAVSANVVANRTSITTGIDIASTYVGQTSITTLGTITTGTWSGTTVAVGSGGTGATTLTGLVKGNGTSAFTAAVAGTDYLSPSSAIDGGTF